MNAENSTKISTRPYFENLTSLRFVGALSVFFFHVFTLHREIWGDFYNESWFQNIYRMMSKGHVGINLFFVLSGFLITYLLLWEQKKNGKINLKNYLIRRTLRVWPLYFLIILFGFFIFPLLPYGVETIHELWRYAFFLANFDELIVGMNDSINFLTAIWTVAVEEQFYIVWGLLIGLFSFKKKEMYSVFFTVILIASIVFRAFYVNDGRILYFHTLSVMSDLAIGGFIGIAIFKGMLVRFFENLSRPIIVVIYLVGAFILIFEHLLYSGVGFAFARLLPALFFAFIILEQVFSKKSFIKLDKIPLMKFSGEISYGFYMFHCIFIYYWAMFFETNNWTEHLYQFVLYTILVFVSTYLTAVLSYYYFERPFLALKKKFK